MNRIALIQMGGTIDSLGRDRLDMTGYLETGSRLAPSELMARLPELASIAEVHEIPHERVGSYALSTKTWVETSRLVRRLLSNGYHGVVITHGTNTLEETAYFLHLTLPVGRPVVITGAMRPANALSSDGDMNLVRAVQVAVCPDSGGRGVLVVLNDTILAARDATKANTHRLDAFTATDGGPLGYVDLAGSVVYYARSERIDRKQPFELTAVADLPQVEILLSYVGADAALVRSIVQSGAVGIVVAGTGAGMPTLGQLDALKGTTVDGLVVCLASRVGSGRVGDLKWLRAIGFVTADNLLPWKARVLLALALTTTRDQERIQSFFDRF